MSMHFQSRMIILTLAGFRSVTQNPIPDQKGVIHMKNKNLIKVISIALLFLLLFVNSSVSAAEGSSDKFIFQEPNDPVTFHTILQQEAIEAGADQISKFSNMGEEELSLPEGITIRWNYEDASIPDCFIVKISNEETMDQAKEYHVIPQIDPGSDPNYPYCLTFQNLLLGTTYYYTVRAGENISDVHSFSTSSLGPRNLYIEGVTNVRDIGGWATSDGGHVKQGMLIRCGQLNTEETTTPCITEAGIQALLDLGIRTEIDLRRTDDNEQGGITESPLGSEVQYYSLPVTGIVDISKDVDSIRSLFRLLADSSNYPMIYHCQIGTDRTGLVSYLILTLCGVSIEDIHMDFAFSNLALIHARREPHNLDKRVKNNFEDYSGSTPQETVRNYLRSIGITDEEMDQIVSILVE